MRQNEVYQYVLHTDELNWDHAGEHRGLKVFERRVRVKDFLCWKTRQILTMHQVEVPKEAFRQIVERIEALDDDSEPDFTACRDLLRAL